MRTVWHEGLIRSEFSAQSFWSLEADHSLHQPASCQSFVRATNSDPTNSISMIPHHDKRMYTEITRPIPIIKAKARSLDQRILIRGEYVLGCLGPLYVYQKVKRGFISPY